MRETIAAGPVFAAQAVDHPDDPWTDLGVGPAVGVLPRTADGQTRTPTGRTGRLDGQLTD